MQPQRLVRVRVRVLVLVLGLALVQLPGLVLVRAPATRGVAWAQSFQGSGQEAR